eukprot:Plantae.Rhodophyta-Hildenbrandia_rubra.ctg22626.p1 GENE.Plantae.Rhodophyta-Hildenbrandia_rubra.ctg22626~~Plantae.Rhodophyta-Hildenbrandia_rubra.ctg22626.p1  ORF type:complete len:500 (+),score=84.29 Plantae.Rhodophyta-Hildenbrandia_rubra.ctg22626:1122-2621(+)
MASDPTNPEYVQDLPGEQLADEGGTTPPVREFALPVDEKNRAKVIKILSLRRPHMRAFHFAWLSFFLAFFGWFALSPLLSTIQDNTTWLSKDNTVNSNIIGLAGTILMRIVIGPVCDAIGPRFAQAGILILFSVPVFLVGTSQSFAAFSTARFFIGFIGASFVVTQFWTSVMFSSNVVGTANATSGGWGNLGGGVTNALMPQIVKGIEKAGLSPDKAWRVSMVIPGASLIICALALFFLSDDLPEGNYRKLEKEGTKQKTNPLAALGRAAKNWRSWLLFALYACCFGVELIMNGNLAIYFEKSFDVSKGNAGLIAGLFGLMNIFARTCGGIVSDFGSKKFGMRGRLWSFFFLEFIEGIMLVIFSRMRTLAGAIPMLVLFSLFVQMSEGATFGIVPFVDPEATGAVSGIVGAGGNFGAVVLSFLLKVDSDRVEGGDKAKGFLYLGFVVIGVSFTIAALWWPQYGSMFTKPTIDPKTIDDEPVTSDAETPENIPEPVAVTT